MDEYEKLEEELQQVYDDYMLKFRNQAYLENILDEYQRSQLDENEVSFFTIGKVVHSFPSDFMHIC